LLASSQAPFDFATYFAPKLPFHSYVHFIDGTLAIHLILLCD
jgi:hypothetical protein